MDEEYVRWPARWWTVDLPQCQKSSACEVGLQRRRGARWIVQEWWGGGEGDAGGPTVVGGRALLGGLVRKATQP